MNLEQFMLENRQRLYEMVATTCSKRVIYSDGPISANGVLMQSYRMNHSMLLSHMDDLPEIQKTFEEQFAPLVEEIVNDMEQSGTNPCYFYTVSAYIQPAMETFQPQLRFIFRGKL